jgi:hypothetical protein
VRKTLPDNAEQLACNTNFLPESVCPRAANRPAMVME